MLTIDQVQTIGRTVSLIALDIYDKEAPAGLMGAIAQDVPNPGGEKTVRVEWWDAFPELLQWIDKKVVQKAYADSLSVEIEPFEITYAFDRFQSTFKTGLVKAQDLATRIGKGFGQGKLIRALRPIRENEVCFDGQNLLDTDHVHIDGSTGSNVVTSSRGTAATPTLAEANTELKLALARLQQNTMIRNAFVETNEAVGDTLVIVRSYAGWAAYYDLLTQPLISTSVENRFRGKFRLARDFSPASGTENTVDVINATPGGPRPSVMVVHQEPSGLMFDSAKYFDSREIPFGMEGAYGFGAGFWQPIVRVTQP